jgi:hypothetical protein
VGLRGDSSGLNRRHWSKRRAAFDDRKKQVVPVQTLALFNLEFVRECYIARKNKKQYIFYFRVFIASVTICIFVPSGRQTSRQKTRNE